MVAALNIVASLILLVMEKSRDIAILKTMGDARRASITLIFMLQGLDHRRDRHGRRRASAGCALIYVLDRYRLITIPSDVYQVALPAVQARCRSTSSS